MSWKVVLAVLTGNVIFMASSYTMLIPFLPMYLTHELGVTPEHVNLWAGVVFSATFVVSSIMAPIWGRLADTRGKRVMAIRASFLLAVSYFLGGVVSSPLELVGMRVFQGFAAGLWPMDLAIMTLYAPPDKLGVCLGVLLANRLIHKTVITESKDDQDQYNQQNFFFRVNFPAHAQPSFSAMVR